MPLGRRGFLKVLGTGAVAASVASQIGITLPPAMPGPVVVKPPVPVLPPLVSDDFKALSFELRQDSMELPLWRGGDPHTIYIPNPPELELVTSIPESAFAIVKALWREREKVPVVFRAEHFHIHFDGVLTELEAAYDDDINDDDGREHARFQGEFVNVGAFSVYYLPETAPAVPDALVIAH